MFFGGPNQTRQYRVFALPKFLQLPLQQRPELLILDQPVHDPVRLRPLGLLRDDLLRTPLVEDGSAPGAEGVGGRVVERAGGSASKRGTRARNGLSIRHAPRAVRRFHRKAARSVVLPLPVAADRVAVVGLVYPLISCRLSSMHGSPFGRRSVMDAGDKCARDERSAVRAGVNLRCTLVTTCADLSHHKSGTGSVPRTSL